MPQRTNGLSAHQLKLLALAAMLIDHLAWAFVPTASLAGQLLHLVGRLTAPIMCFFLAEGYFHTRSIDRYLLRMGVFAAVSVPAFLWFESAGRYFWDFRLAWNAHALGMIYTLFLALLALRVWFGTPWHPVVRFSVVAVLYLLSERGDWHGIGVIWPLLFAQFRDEPKLKFRLYALTAVLYALELMQSMTARTGIRWVGLFQFGTLLAIPLLRYYNGRRGGGAHTKWLFYVFYPAHLMVLGTLRRLWAQGV